MKAVADPTRCTRDPAESPSTISSEIRKWMGQNGVSVGLFAQEVLHRSQGTVSSLLNHPPKTFPKGAGSQPWLNMQKFLQSPEEQEKILNHKKGTVYFKHCFKVFINKLGCLRRWSLLFIFFV